MPNWSLLSTCGLTRERSKMCCAKAGTKLYKIYIYTHKYTGLKNLGQNNTDTVLV